jgi:pyruvate ferredoxin oxidoreductase gamma subunit
MFTARVLGSNGEEILVTAGLLAAAAAREGRQATVTSVRLGAALCVIDGRGTAPGGPPAADALIVQDPGELRRADAFAGLSPEAYLLVNSTCGFGDLGLAGRVDRFCRDRALILPVTRLEPGLHDASIRGSSMIGGFAALSRVVGLDSVISAIKDRTAGHIAPACAAAASAYEFVRVEKEAVAA